MKKRTAVYLGVLALVGMVSLVGYQIGGRSARYVAPVVQVSEKTLLDYAQNIAFMRGHLRAAVANIEEDGLLQNIHAHASHPTVEGYYKDISQDLEQRDPGLASELESVLLNISKETKTARFASAQTLLNDTLTTLVPPEKLNDSGFRIKVMIKILEKSAHEYEEGITADGKVKLAEEYQDAFGFFWESEELFRQIEAEIPAQKNREIGQLMGKLGKIFRSVVLTGDPAAPKRVDKLVGDIVSQLTVLIGK